MLHTDITSDDIRAMHSVEGRVIIVTGSAQGVGRGMAHHLGKAGATVVVADYQAEKLQRTCEELTSFGARQNTCVRSSLDSRTSNPEPPPRCSG